MPDSVVDASVIAAIVFEEHSVDAAISMIRGIELFAPTILNYELTNVARTKAIRDPAHEEEIASALESALELDIRSVDVDHMAVLRLALDTGLTAYDASYLYVSRRLGMPLVTFDDQLSRAGRGDPS